MLGFPCPAKSVSGDGCLRRSGKSTEICLPREGEPRLSRSGEANRPKWEIIMLFPIIVLMITFVYCA